LWCSCMHSFGESSRRLFTGFSVLLYRHLIGILTPVLYGFISPAPHASLTALKALYLPGTLCVFVKKLCFSLCGLFVRPPVCMPLQKLRKPCKHHIYIYIYTHMQTVRCRHVLELMRARELVCGFVCSVVRSTTLGIWSCIRFPYNAVVSLQSIY